LSPAAANGCCGFGEGTFASTSRNGQDAPKAVVRRGTIEPLESTHNRRWRPRQRIIEVGKQTFGTRGEGRSGAIIAYWASV
jgi:hypothetical protein